MAVVWTSFVPRLSIQLPVGYRSSVAGLLLTQPPSERDWLRGRAPGQSAFPQFGQVIIYSIAWSRGAAQMPSRRHHLEVSAQLFLSFKPNR